jgi:hypothetical protein
MPVIDDYYPALVQTLLECDETTTPFVLLVDKDAFERQEDEDPDDCPPPVLNMFPKESEVYPISMDSWLSFGMKDEGQFGPSAEQSMVSELAKNQNAICLVLPILNALAGLGNEKTRDVRNGALWNPLFKLLDVLPQAAKLLIPVPIRLLQLPGYAEQRKRLFDEHRALIIEHEDPYCAIRFRMGGVYDNHRMATVVVWKEKGPLTFYRLTKPDLKDFHNRLPLLLSGRTTRVIDGFVSDKIFDLHKPTLFDSYKPDQTSNPDSGRLLSQIAEVLCGPHRVAGEAGTMSCFTAKCITLDLIVDFQWMIHVNDDTPPEPGTRLQQGDLVVRSKTDCSGRLLLARLDVVPEKALFDESVMVIRFKAEVPEHTRELVLTILQSPAAASVLLLKGPQPDHDLDPEWVRSLRLPIDDDTVADYLKIHKMRDEFASWTERAEQLLQGLLWEDSPESIRHRIQRRERQLRLIHQAGASVGNPDHLIARYYPRPLSFVWAEYRASRRAGKTAYYERMAKARKAGETLVAFLALVAASYLHARDINILKGCQLSRNPKNKKKGFDLGSLAEAFKVSCNKLKGISPPDPAMPDFGSFLDDVLWNDALTSFIDIRNADSHLRLSTPALAAKALEVETNLKFMFNRVEFLTDWSLRIVDLVQTDPHSGSSRVSYRELHGSMLHVETSSCVVEGNRLGSGYLYLVNKLGGQRWHLLDPFLKLLECRHHRFESIFQLDSVSSNKKRPEDVILRSLEFNSTFETSLFNKIFSKCGMLDEISTDVKAHG